MADPCSGEEISEQFFSFSKFPQKEIKYKIGK
jgi:hypothetical protein